MRERWIGRVVRPVMAGCVLAGLGAGCAASGGDPTRRGGVGILDGGAGEIAPAEEPAFNVETRFAAGQLAESQNVPQRAVEQYLEALKLDANHQPSLFRLALVYTQTKQYPQAIEAWKRYVDVTKGSPTAYSNLGLCYELAGQPQQAEATFKVGIANAPRHEACAVNYGLMLARQGRRDEALAQLQTVLPPAKAHYNMGSVYEQQGRLDQARQDYAKAMELDPAFRDARVRLQRLSGSADAR